MDFSRKSQRIPSSFRDPSGFLFSRDGVLYRQINRQYKDHFDHLIQSGLYETLVQQGLLIPHFEVDISPEEESMAYKIIQPELIHFISYPYEWCFSQLKDAALATLKIQKQALDYNMFLKDASAYNIQYHDGKPVLIDTLSFEIYKENQPWVAYRQFCQQFLAPLALIASKDIRLGQLMRIHIDGLPLDLVSELLPISTWLKPTTLTHIHLHAKAQKRYSNSYYSDGRDKSEGRFQRRKVSKNSLIALIHSLESAITSMRWHSTGTEWFNYYEDNNYSPKAMIHKKQLVEDYLTQTNPSTVWDLGANTGVFSRIASAKGVDTIAFDADPAAVEKNYQQMRQDKETKILPLCLDLANPSSSSGWANEERLSLLERGPADTVLALALIHHLIISNNTPLNNVAAFLAKMCRFLIIEFIPKNDSQVQKLLHSREDIFYNYTQEYFEKVFSHYFLFLKSRKLPDTLRIIYLMQRKCLIN